MSSPADAADPVEAPADETGEETHPHAEENAEESAAAEPTAPPDASPTDDSPPSEEAGEGGDASADTPTTPTDHPEPSGEKAEGVSSPEQPAAPSPTQTSATTAVRGTRNLDNMNTKMQMWDKGVLLDSPRSLTVLARNGITIASMFFRPFSVFLKESQGDKEVARRRHRHWQGRREQLLSHLREERKMMPQIGADEPMPQRGAQFALSAPPTNNAGECKRGGSAVGESRAENKRSATAEPPPTSPRSRQEGGVSPRSAPSSPNQGMSAAAMRRREEGAQRMHLELQKLDKLKVQAIKTREAAERDEKKTQERIMEREKKMQAEEEIKRQQELQSLRDKLKNEREQRKRQNERDEARRRRKQDEILEQERRNEEYRHAENERVKKLAQAQATKDRERMEARALNLQKQQQIQMMVQMLSERREAEMKRRQEKAEEIRRDFELKRADESKARRSEAQERSHKLQGRLKRAQEQEELVICEMKKKAQAAEQRLAKREKELAHKRNVKILQEQDQEKARIATVQKAKVQEEEKRQQILDKQERQSKLQEKMFAARQHENKMRRVEKELAIQDRLDVVERMQMVRNYETEIRIARLEEKAERVAEMEKQDALLQKERRRHREDMWKSRVTRTHMTPGPGDYIGCFVVSPRSQLRGRGAVIGGAIARIEHESSGPGPAAYQPRLDVTVPYHGTSRFVLQTKDGTGVQSPQRSRKNPSSPPAGQPKASDKGGSRKEETSADAKEEEKSTADNHAVPAKELPDAESSPAPAAADSTDAAPPSADEISKEDNGGGDKEGGAVEDTDTANAADGAGTDKESPPVSE